MVIYGPKYLSITLTGASSQIHTVIISITANQMVLDFATLLSSLFEQSLAHGPSWLVISQTILGPAPDQAACGPCGWEDGQVQHHVHGLP